MKNIAAVIFDMDGTIVQTENLWRSASHAILSKSKLQLSTELLQEFYNRSHGLAIRETCSLIKEYGELEESIEELVMQKRIIARNLYTQGISFINGFPEFHYKISRLNLKSGVATNADEYTLQTTNQKMNLAKFFGEHLYSIEVVNNRCKPHPDIYLYAAEKLNVNPATCIAVEDSAHGIAAAKAAGMFCIGINTSHDLNQIKHADMIVETYDAIDLHALRKQ